MNSQSIFKNQSLSPLTDISITLTLIRPTNEFNKNIQALGKAQKNCLKKWVRATLPSHTLDHAGQIDLPDKATRCSPPPVD